MSFFLPRGQPDRRFRRVPACAREEKALWSHRDGFGMVSLAVQPPALLEATDAIRSSPLGLRGALHPATARRHRSFVLTIDNCCRVCGVSVWWFRSDRWSRRCRMAVCQPGWSSPRNVPDGGSWFAPGWHRRRTRRHQWFSIVRRPVLSCFVFAHRIGGHPPPRPRHCREDGLPE